MFGTSKNILPNGGEKLRFTMVESEKNHLKNRSQIMNVDPSVHLLGTGMSPVSLNTKRNVVEQLNNFGSYGTSTTKSWGRCRWSMIWTFGRSENRGVPWTQYPTGSMGRTIFLPTWNPENIKQHMFSRTSPMDPMVFPSLCDCHGVSKLI